MDPDIFILSEVSQIEKDKYMNITYVWNLKKKKIQMNLLTKQEQTHSLWKPTYG